MTIATNVTSNRVQPLILPTTEAIVDNAESAGDEEVISTGCWCCVALLSTDIAKNDYQGYGLRMLSGLPRDICNCQIILGAPTNFGRWLTMFKCQ